MVTSLPARHFLPKAYLSLSSTESFDATKCFAEPDGKIRTYRKTQHSILRDALRNPIFDAQEFFSLLAGFVLNASLTMPRVYEDRFLLIKDFRNQRTQTRSLGHAREPTKR
nr:unnamed protein product [Spirometra erinaceieuropaei]